MRLEQALVLNRYCLNQFGVQSFQALKQVLFPVTEGLGGDGYSHFYHVLAELKGLVIPAEALRAYDRRVMEYETRLAQARGAFTFKYFQYLALLYTELYLDRLSANPGGFLQELNAFLERLKSTDPAVRHFVPFDAVDLRRLAFFMATGSGKTLLLHTNLWQVLHYLEHGRHPEALVRRTDGSRAFDSILLVTRNEGLSQQHLGEFAKSDIDAALLIADRTGQRGLEPRVHVIEIHKLAEQASGEGVSIPLEELGAANLVFVDEGHKGTGSEAQTWKTRQEGLSQHGFLIEYSATFAQAIGATSPKRKELLLADYGKSILFDYSYRYFYTDGYGKDFRVLNLSKAREQQAFELLLGGLLVYSQQVRLYRNSRAVYRPFQVEPPRGSFSDLASTRCTRGTIA